MKNKKNNNLKAIEKYSAKNRIGIMKEKYKNKMAWVLFAEKIQFDSFFRSDKLQEQNYECPICEEVIHEFSTLHHISYDHECQLFKLKNTQNCQLCKSHFPNFHIGCAKRTVIVHYECHTKLHGKSKLD